MVFPDSGARSSNTRQGMHILHSTHAEYGWLKSYISHAGWLDPEWILPHFRMVRRSIAIAAFLLWCIFIERETEMSEINKPQADAAVRRSAEDLQQGGRALGDALRQGAEVNADVARRVTEAGAEAVRRATDAANDTARRGAQAG